ncbi:MAG: tyrosine-type recombinase/integrase [Gaiellaceae bacterium]
MKPRVPAARLAELRGYEANLRRKNRSDRTIAKYLPVVTRYAAWLEERSPGSIRLAEIDAYLDEWYAGFQVEHGRSPAAATTRTQITALKSFYDYLERNELLLDADGNEARNKMALVDPPRRDQKPIDVLTRQEDHALLEYAGCPRGQMIVWLLRETGMRVGELHAAQVGDVDLSKRELRVRVSKTPAGRRTLPLSPELVLRLERWFAQLRADGGLHPAGPLLPTRNGTPAQPTWIWRKLKHVAFEAGVRPTPCTCASTTHYGHYAGCPRTFSGENRSAITPHHLRRTYGSALLNQGARIEVVSRLLGHRSVEVTQQFYAELLDENIREAFNEARGYSLAA